MALVGLRSTATRDKLNRARRGGLTRTGSAIPGRLGVGHNHTVANDRIRVINRPTGTYSVEVRRKGVEPFSALLPFDLVSALQWLPLRLSGKRLWVVEVQAPWSRRRWSRPKRLVFSQDFGSEAEALAAMDPTTARLEAGDFDQPLL